MSDKNFLKVLCGDVTGKVPIWLMRQAGRYLPEYRELRAEKGGFLAMAFDPKAACEITMQPIRRFEMDAAIIFSDILTVPYALGQPLEFVKGEGPKLEPVQGTETLSLDGFDEKMTPVYDALRLTRQALADEGFDDTALIGFAGAPWTVATYMVEGGGSKDFMAVKGFAFAEPEKFAALLDMLVGATSRYLIAQIDAGAEAVKIFDSWAGAVPATQFEDWVIEPTRKIVEAVRKAHPNTPIIGFARGAGVKYPDYIRRTGITAAAFDQFTPLDYAAAELQPLVPVQGNLDPALLLAGGKAMENAVLEILKALGGKPFVFNLGHGVNLNTPPEHVEQLLRIVRGYQP